MQLSLAVVFAVLLCTVLSSHAFETGAIVVHGSHNHHVQVVVAVDLASHKHDLLSVSPRHTHTAMLAKCDPRFAAKPIKCDAFNSSFVRVPMMWECGIYQGTVADVHVGNCFDGYMFEKLTFVLNLGFSNVPRTCQQLILGVPKPNPHNCLLTRTGKPLSLNIRNLDLYNPANVLDLPLLAVLSRTASLLAHHQPTIDHLHMERTPENVCSFVRSQRHLFVTDFATVEMIGSTCGSALDTELPFHKIDGSVISPGDPIPEFVPHVELLEEGTYKLHVVTPASEKAHKVVTASRSQRVSVFDIETAKRHRLGLDAAQGRAKAWLDEIQHQQQQAHEASAVGHKLCVHSLTKPIKEGLLDKHDIGVSAGTGVQMRVAEAVMEQMKVSSKGILGMIVSPIVSIVIGVVAPPFGSAFDAFFGRLLPMVCLFLLMLLLHILFKYGMDELPNAINRPCGTIIVMFLGWPIILVVVMTIYARIGTFIYRNVRLFILRDSVPQIAEPAAHHLTHALTHSLTTSLGHTLSHSLTHTLSHSLSNSVFHFYRCSYCYHYGDQCDQCFYYRDYSWQWRMAWQGNPTLKSQ
eukprot:c9549_g1_i1.p1 GENE.c9549_g1_i1~~c9549_g1_i1.p1  ORF type:complete len:578 (+),score=130.66 c9549_g1_i1:47-1780(+)